MRKIALFLIFIVLFMSVEGIAGSTYSNLDTYNVASALTNVNIVCPINHNTQSESINTKHYSYPYVANANTMVFHRSSCYYINRMKESNKVYYTNRQAAINSGYRPCKVCNP